MKNKSHLWWIKGLLFLKKDNSNKGYHGHPLKEFCGFITSILSHFVHLCVDERLRRFNELLIGLIVKTLTRNKLEKTIFKSELMMWKPFL